MRTEYMEFLDRRIPELHAMGKPPYKPAETLAVEVARAVENTRAQTYPGVTARRKADEEWGQIRRLEEAANA